MRGFRRNCRLALREGKLVVTDRRQRVFRFALDGSPRAPEAYEVNTLGPEWLVVDGNGQALVVGFSEAWDVIEIRDFFETAGVEVRWRADPLPPLREDGVRLEPSPWPYWVAAMPPIGLAGVVLARLDILPPVPVLLFAALTLAAGAVMWARGFFAPARRGPGVVAGEKLIAKLQAEAEAKKAKEEAKKKRRQQRGKR
jgi:hypothetical protein